VRFFLGVLIPIVVIFLGIAVSSDHGAVTAGRDPYRVRVVQTNAGLSQRLTRLRDAEFESRQARAEQTVKVDADVRYQTVQGFGAAMTDSSAWLIERKASTSARATLMRRFFGRDGIGLNVVRVPIGASDFTRDGRPYTYDDLAAGQTDPGLREFRSRTTGPTSCLPCERLGCWSQGPNSWQPRGQHPPG
jgi:hypothetical protein